MRVVRRCALLPIAWLAVSGCGQAYDQKATIEALSALPDPKEVQAARDSLPADLRYVRKQVPISKNAYLLLDGLQGPPLAMSFTTELSEGLTRRDKAAAKKVEALYAKSTKWRDTVLAAAGLPEYQPPAISGNPLKDAMQGAGRVPSAILRIEWLRLADTTSILGMEREAGVMLHQANLLFQRMLTSDESSTNFALRGLDLMALDGAIRRYAQQPDVPVEALKSLLVSFASPENLRTAWNAMMIRDLNCDLIPGAVLQEKYLRRSSGKGDYAELKRLPNAFVLSDTVGMLVALVRKEFEGVDSPYIPAGVSWQTSLDAIYAPALTNSADPMRHDPTVIEALKKVPNPMGKEFVSLYGMRAANDRTFLFRVQAYSAVTRLCVALEIYYRLNDKMPEKLSDLPQAARIPGLTIDPTTGQEFSYSKAERRVWIANSDVILQTNDFHID